MRHRWSAETFTCSLRGHLVPAAHVVTLRPEDSGLGVDLPDGRRLARCLRCDSWVALAAGQASAGAPEVLPPYGEIQVPLRGRTLRESLVLRLIAVERGVHSVIFGLVAAGLLAVGLNLPVVKASVQRWAVAVDSALGSSGPVPTRSWLSRELHSLLTIRSSSLRWLFLTAAGYCVLEGFEAVGLWLGHRWAEYLTAVATAGYLPFEIIGISDGFAWFRAGLLVLNVAVLLWLVATKRLFGLGRWWPKHIEVLQGLFEPGTVGAAFVRRE